MSAVNLRDMPIITARPAPGFPGHWCAVIDGTERTYPSQDAMRSAARRLAGASVRFDPAPRAAANDTGSLPVLPPQQREAPDASPVRSPASPRTAGRTPRPVSAGADSSPG